MQMTCHRLQNISDRAIDCSRGHLVKQHRGNDYRVCTLALASTRQRKDIPQYVKSH